MSLLLRRRRKTGRLLPRSIRRRLTYHWRDLWRVRPSLTALGAGLISTAVFLPLAITAPTRAVGTISVVFTFTLAILSVLAAAATAIYIADEHEGGHQSYRRLIKQNRARRERPHAHSLPCSKDVDGSYPHYVVITRAEGDELVAEIKRFTEDNRSLLMRTLGLWKPDRDPGYSPRSGWAGKQESDMKGRVDANADLDDILSMLAPLHERAARLEAEGYHRAAKRVAVSGIAAAFQAPIADARARAQLKVAHERLEISTASLRQLESGGRGSEAAGSDADNAHTPEYGRQHGPYW